MYNSFLFLIWDVAGLNLVKDRVQCDNISRSFFQYPH